MMRASELVVRGRGGARDVAASRGRAGNKAVPWLCVDVPRTCRRPRPARRSRPLRLYTLLWDRFVHVDAAVHMS
jgi:hypothetical protein